MTIRSSTGRRTGTHEAGGAWVQIRVVLAVVLAAGCTAAPTDEPAPPPPPTLIQFELPPEAKWRRPADAEATLVSPTPIEVEPGTHDFAISYHCTAGAIRVEARAGATTVIELAAVTGLQLASFIPKATSLAGAPLGVDVFLGLDEAPKLASVGFGESVIVPACAERIRIAATDASLELGGFIEDIEFAPGAVVTREVVLSRGPDMVRIHGGKMRYTHRDLRHPLDLPRALWGKTSERIAEVPTFDIDRTEVTTDQYMACSNDAMTRAKWDQFGVRSACDWKEECARRGACFERGFDGGPSELCTADTAWHEKPYRAWGPPRVMRPGKGNFPMNCVSNGGAERYCAWVGKRLAIGLEFEYAARSGSFERESPCDEEDPRCFWRRTTYWGGLTDETRWIIDNQAPGTPEVRHPIEEWASRSAVEMAATDSGPHEVCARPYTRTRQGVCDMLHNVQEWVAWSRERRCGPDFNDGGTHGSCQDHMIGTRGGSWFDGYEEVFKTTRLQIMRYSDEVFAELVGRDRPDMDLDGTTRGGNSYRSLGHVSTGGARIGFRCVRDVDYPVARAGSTVIPGEGMQ